MRAIAIARRKRTSTRGARSSLVDVAVPTTAAERVLEAHEVATKLCHIAHSVHDSICQSIDSLVSRQAALGADLVVDEGVSSLQTAVLIKGVGLN
jgi:hypothetical protein